MKSLKRSVLLFGMIISSFVFFSCSRLMGYSVVLWSMPEQNLSDGDIVPVYIKSNITQSYVIGIPETDTKCDVPLWQISEPAKKKDVQKLAEKFSEYQHKYARVKLDGLPIRFEPVNTARQVYRLRENEIIRVLYKVDGAEVRTGKSSLKGEWLKVLTSDGTTGYCFSYNLYVYDEREENPDATVKTDEFVIDEELTAILSSTWYPDYFKTMISRGKIDLREMNPNYKFDTGFISGEISLNLKEVSVKFPYKGITRAGNNIYQFTETPLKMTVRGPGYIVIQYVNQNGMPSSYDLVLLEEDINEVITKEQERREEIFNVILMNGPVFSSSNYGTIQLSEDFNFSWTGYNLLTPSLIPANSGTTGKVSFDYFLSSALASEFDGFVTFKFDGNGKEVNFFYKLEDNGIRLEDGQKAQFKNSNVINRSPNPVVMFFAK